MGKFYITTAIPYVNGKPHIGHLLEYFQADTIKRFHDILGDRTLLLSGADENALKNVQAAEKEGTPVKEFLDKNSLVFKNAFDFFKVKLDVFERGSDKTHHFPGVQKLWKLCEKNGDIYKKSYTGLYCVGCESFKTPRELINDLCPDHNTKPEEITEENYFFRLSRYQQHLLAIIESGEFAITPDNKKAEIVAFIKSGLEDFSISRSKERARGVGVPVPGDNNQIIYVWFDALAIYLTGIGYGVDDKMFEKWWPADLHIIGKDINRFHTVYWPAMLLSAKLALPKEVLVHGFVLSGGQKMSKSIGNVIDPFSVIKTYGLEPVRYFLLSQVPIDSDGDFTEKRFKEVYNADLANGLGNLVARVAKLCETAGFSQMLSPSGQTAHLVHLKDYSQAFTQYRFSDALAVVWQKIARLDKYINEAKPWELQKANNPKLKAVLAHSVDQIQEIGALLEPFLPETARKIEKQFKNSTITMLKPLFPRL